MNSFDLHIQKASESPSENKNVQNSSDEKLRPSVKEQSSERAKVSGAKIKFKATMRLNPQLDSKSPSTHAFPRKKRDSMHEILHILTVFKMRPRFIFSFKPGKGTWWHIQEPEFRF